MEERSRHEVKRQGEVREDFRRARDERNEHAAKIASLTAIVDTQKIALAEAEEFKKNAGAHRAALEEKIQDLNGAVKFQDEAIERMNIVRRAEAKELAENQAAMETSKSRAQIAWDWHEELSKQLKTVQDDLAKAKEAHAKEERDFRHYLRSNDELLLKMHA